MDITKKELGDWRVVVADLNAFSKDDVMFPQLVHGGDIVLASECTSGETAADGIVVSEPNVKVGVTTADCMPLAVLSANKGVVLHASRKSLIHGLLDKVPEIIPPAEITHVFIGPHICQQHFAFEWEGEDITAFKERFPTATEKDGELHLSLMSAVQSYLTKWDVSPDKISRDERCTQENNELASYKRWLAEGNEGPVTTRIATVIWREE